MKTFKTPDVKVSQLATVLALSLMTAACATPQASGPDPVSVQTGSDTVSRVERLLKYCDRLHEGGDIYMASGMCVRAHELDPSEPRPMMKLAEIFTQVDRKEDAISAYKTVLEHNPGHTEALYRLGRLYLDLGEEDKALQTFEIAALRDPGNWRVHNVIGVLKDKHGQHAVAQEHYRAALEADPNNLSVKSNLGLSLALGGEKKEALEVLGQVVADPNASAVAFHNLEIAQNVPDPENAVENNVVEDPKTIESVNISRAEPISAPMIQEAPAQRPDMATAEAELAEAVEETFKADTSMASEAVTSDERADVAALELVGQDDTAVTSEDKAPYSIPYSGRPNYVGSYPVALLPKPNPARSGSKQKQVVDARPGTANQGTATQGMTKIEPASQIETANLEREMVLQSRAESVKSLESAESKEVAKAKAASEPGTSGKEEAYSSQRLQLVALTDPSIRPIPGTPQVTFRGRY